MEKTATPKHLWIVGVVAVLWNAMGVFDYLMTETRNPGYMAHFTPEQLEFYYSYPASAIACWAFGVWGSLLGSVLLLLRIRWAGAAFIVAFAGLVGSTIYTYGIAHGAEMTGAGGMFFMGLVYVISILLILYSRWMCKRGVLR